jgi:16S rRNA (guanine(966)-N(2))-methyltransferase RsmD
MQINNKLELRIVSGKYRRRKIFAPNSVDVRPTKDRIREALFSSLGNISNLSILDLYAGSGAISLEALSRGATSATLVDINKESIKCIKDNFASLNVEEDYEILFMSDILALNKFKEENKSFDIIYLDPPYQKGKYIDIINFILENNIINNNGIIISESNYELDIDENLFSKHKKHKYGEIIINIYWR